eukprot:TRINITY_DN32557_c0_g1_i1.p1 TRINITY_DN32557_c0_g1~~TRINITY_DN32557_c0_g1_i1.p1  ORF type:complete len:194 (+),score=44.54 TRINITY_DN32557_c0_g1_i1:212-793(+)
MALSCACHAEEQGERLHGRSRELAEVNARSGGDCEEEAPPLEPAVTTLSPQPAPERGFRTRGFAIPLALALLSLVAAIVVAAAIGGFSCSSSSMWQASLMSPPPPLPDAGCRKVGSAVNFGKQSGALEDLRFPDAAAAEFDVAAPNARSQTKPVSGKRQNLNPWTSVAVGVLAASAFLHASTPARRSVLLLGL